MADPGQGQRAPVVFVCDASAEADRIADTLRSSGYVVEVVSLAHLSSRAASQRPNLVVIDVDVEGALGALATLRAQSGSGSIDFIHMGSGDGPIQDVSPDGSAFFRRPVDLAVLVRKIEALTGGPASASSRPSSPPPSIAVRPFLSSVPPERPSSPSLPAPGARPSMPMSTPSLVDLVDPPRSFATFGSVSPELQQLLAEAEMRLDGTPPHLDALPSPEDELEAVLPADVLASLDDPLEDAEVELSPPPQPETSPGRGTTSSGSRPPTTSGGRATRSGSDPPRTNPLTTPVSIRTETRSEVRTDPRAEVRVDPPRPSAAPPDRGRATVLGPGESRKFFADAVAKRWTGALCFEHEAVVRRLVLRDGDLVTAASGSERESLVHFLGSRGELPREEVPKLAAKVPPYGRHAGAALVAHGWLRQDQLWTVLRAHCEWIATEVLRQEAGTAQLEGEPPGRLRNEPSVFAASTGPEIFVELVKRATSTDDAVRRLGGLSSRVADGPRPHLLVECNLAPPDVDLISRGRGATLGDLVSRAPDTEIAAVVHALALLGVLEIVPSAIARPSAAAPKPVTDDLDEDAIRSRIRARLELVEEGDYFALLGVSRDATGYEVRRAFFELRRAFEPSRILTPRLADLGGDVRKIVVVLEEAYEILRDEPRRERYRRAIEARPA